MCDESKYTLTEVLTNFDDHLTEYEKLEIHCFASRLFYFAPYVRKQNGDVRKPRNHNYDTKHGYYKIVLNDHMFYRYQIIRKMGLGSYGTVVHAKDHKYNRDVAIKIFKISDYAVYSAERELLILDHLMERDEDSKNLLKCYSYFNFRSHTCITYELLDRDLRYMIDANPNGLPLNIIQPIIKSVLHNLNYLHKNGVVHTDIKPDNIVFISRNKLETKIIDFGLANLSSETSSNLLVQPLLFRAPEILLQVNYDTKIDMWSLGCTIAELRTGKGVLRGRSMYEMMGLYVTYFGFPPLRQILLSPIKDCYFNISKKHTVTYKLRKGLKSCTPFSKSLSKAIKNEKDPEFLSFLRGCFEMDPEKRMSPEQALKHAWIEKCYLSPKTDHFLKRKSKSKI